MPNAPRIEIYDIDGRTRRQISEKTRVTQQLRDRRADIEGAIAEAAEIAQASLLAPTDDRLHVSSLEITFGLTLSAEAGVIVSKASAEASIEVKITIDRG